MYIPLHCAVCTYIHHYTYTYTIYKIMILYIEYSIIPNLKERNDISILIIQMILQDLSDGRESVA